MTIVNVNYLNTRELNAANDAAKVAGIKEKMNYKGKEVEYNAEKG